MFIISVYEPEMLQASDSISLSIPDSLSGSTTNKIIQLMALVTVLSLAPSILIMITSFTRIVVVLSFIRNAMGLQQTPPNMVIISLAMFLTLFVMMPTLEESYTEGVKPYINEQIEEEEAITKTFRPFHIFMLKQTNRHDLESFFDIARIQAVETPDDIPFRILIPAFMVSELKRAFEIGFVIFIPFLIIDLLVASTLMTMGMMMLPPVIISLPFKIVFFVLIDGWTLISESLIKSFI